MSTEVIVAFIVGLLVGLLIGWFYWGRRLEECQANVRSLTSSLQQKDRDLQSWKSRAEQAEGSLKQKEAQMAALQTPSTRAPEPKIDVAKPEPDDLKVIEGIGPKISQVLQATGILTLAQLAATTVERLQQILDEAGMTLADPATWPDQARLAASGDWAALEKLQDELKGGRRV